MKTIQRSFFVYLVLISCQVLSQKINKIYISDSTLKVEEILFYKLPYLYVSNVDSIKRSFPNEKILHTKEKKYSINNYFFTKSGLQFVFSLDNKFITNLQIHFKSSSLFSGKIKRKVRLYSGSVIINNYTVNENTTFLELKKLTEFKSCMDNGANNAIYLFCKKGTCTICFESADDNAKIRFISIDF